MDNFQGPYLEVNRSGKELSSNESFRKLRPELRRELIDSCREVIKTNVPKLFSKNIQNSFYDLSVLPVSNSDGTTECAVVTGFPRPNKDVFQIFQNLIFDNIPIVIFYVQYAAGEFTFRAINKAFLVATGLREDEVLDRNVKDVIPRESHELVLKNYQKAIQNKQSVSWEEKSEYPVGRKYGEVMVFPVFDENENCMGLIGTVHDITDRKSTELELQRNFSLLNSVVEGTTDAVFIKDLKGRYIMLNSSTARFHGRPKEEILHKSDSELADPEVAELYAGHDQEVIRTGVTKTFLEEGSLGGRYQCFLSLKGPYKDHEGKTIGIIGLSRDITELKESQKALEESKKEIWRYSMRLKKLSDLSVSLSKAQLDLNKIRQTIVEEASWAYQGGAVLEVLNDDDSLGSVYYFHTDPNINLELEKLYLEGQLNLCPELNDEVLESGMVLKKPLSGIKGLEGKMLYALPMKLSDKPSIIFKLIGTEEDFSLADLTFLRTFIDRSALAIGNARLFQKAKEAVQIREDFIQVASHELRTPLTPLRLQLGLLKRFVSTGVVAISPQGKHLLKIIKDADRHVLRLSNLISDLIDVTKFSSEKIILNLHQTHLRKYVETIFEEFKKLHQDMDIEIVTNIPEASVGNVDQHKLQRALVKILENAVQFGLSKPILLRASVEREMFEVRIQDYGMGISEKDQQRIFGAFERCLSVNSYGGLGMGLYIARRIIEAHSGTIDLRSEPNQGSTFIIRIPLY